MPIVAGQMQTGQPQVFALSTTDRMSSVWPTGTLVFDTTQFAFFRGDSATAGGVPTSLDFSLGTITINPSTGAVTQTTPEGLTVTTTSTANQIRQSYGSPVNATQVTTLNSNGSITITMETA